MLFNSLSDFLLSVVDPRRQEVRAPANASTARMEAAEKEASASSSLDILGYFRGRSGEIVANNDCNVTGLEFMRARASLSFFCYNL